MNQISRLQFCTCANLSVLYCCKNEESRCSFLFSLSHFFIRIPLSIRKHLCVLCQVFRVGSLGPYAILNLSNYIYNTNICMYLLSKEV